MKKGYKIFIFSIVISIGFISIAQGATNWPYGSPVNNSVTVLANQNFKRTGDLKFTRNNSTLRISGRLKVIGDVIIDDVNSFSIIIENGGSFEVTGNINITSKGGGGGSAPSINIDGVLSADSIIGNGSITGSGVLNTNSISGLNYNGFTGPIINDSNTAINFPSPFGLLGEELPNLKVELNWGFNNGSINGYTFVGFQVIRNMGGSQDVDEVIEGAIVNGVFTGSTSTTFTDSNLSVGAIPRYYIKAVFSKQLKSSGDYIFSGGSNVKDFFSNPLPIDLLYFNAKAEGTVVQMDWATATEINNDFFTIERSANGRNWDVIGYLQGAGNANHTINYNFTDMNPLTGISYYRLKQTDFDGKFEYFAPVAINFNAAIKAGEILSAAAHGQRLNLWVNNPDAAATVVVANMQGRVLYQGNVTAADYAQQIQIDIAQNIAGEILIIRLSSSQSSDERKIMAR